MPQQRPPRRPMPQDTAAARNARARERAIRAEEQRKLRYYRRKKRAETLAYAARIFFLAFLASALMRAIFSSVILQNLLDYPYAIFIL